MRRFVIETEWKVHKDLHREFFAWIKVVREHESKLIRDLREIAARYQPTVYEQYLLFRTERTISQDDLERHRGEIYDHDHDVVVYLFCKYGLMKTFEMFGGCTPVVGGLEINEHTYPADQWVVCSSTQINPKGFDRGLYEPSSMRIAVRREDYERTMVRNMIGGLF